MDLINQQLSGPRMTQMSQERQRIEQNPQARGGLGALLDRDGDGQIMDDLANMAGGMLGNRR
jgi:hypothetical protein